MSKKPLNTPIPPQIVKKSDSGNLPALADKIIFSPTVPQQKAKARFWTRFQPGPFANSQNLTLAVAQEVTGVASLKKWWDDPGFQEWFGNREEGREKLEYLFMRSLDAAEQILTDPNAQASAKVNMIKVLSELANKFPSRQVEKYADEDINRMNEQQLKGYLERKGIKITQENVVDVEAETSKKD